MLALRGRRVRASRTRQNVVAAGTRERRCGARRGKR